MKRPCPHLPITGTCEEEDFAVEIPNSKHHPPAGGPNKFQAPNSKSQTNFKKQIPNTPEPWNSGTLELWNSGTLELWNSGTLEPWNPGTLEPWNPGTLEQLNNRTKNLIP